MKRIGYAACVFVLLFVLDPVYSQDEHWERLFGYSDEKTMAVWGNEVWMGFNQGLIKFDTTTKKSELFTSQNSPLKWNYISSLAIDRNGVKWILSNDNATWGKSALLSYDGTKWTDHTFGDNSIAERYSSGIAIDSMDIKWITAGRDIFSYDGKKWTRYSKAETGLPAEYFKSVEIDGKGNKWFLLDSGIVKYDGMKWSLFQAPPENTGLHSFTIDKKGNKWIGSFRGVFKFNDSLWTFYPSPSYLGGSRISADSSGAVWIISLFGVVKFDGIKWTLFDVHNSNLPFQILLDLRVENDNTIWLFSRDGRLASSDGEKWRVYNIPDSRLPFNYLYEIAIDKKNNVWLGSLDYGLVMLNDSSWVLYDTTNSGLPGNHVFLLAIDSLGNLWIPDSRNNPYSDKAYLTKFDGKNWVEFSSDTLTAWFVQCLTIDNKGNKWLGTGDGLIKFNDTSWVKIEGSKGLITKIASDFSGNIWTSAVLWPSGDRFWLQKYDGHNWTVIDDSGASSIVCDKKGTVWFAGASLKSFDGNKWKWYNVPQCNAIAFDNENVLWGTTGRGLLKLKDSSWTEFLISSSGIPVKESDELFYGIAIDSKDNKWMTTWNGNGVWFFGNSGTPGPTGTGRFSFTGERFYTLYQNYPNPFNPVTTIKYKLSKESFVELKIHDILGNEVRVLVNEMQKAGDHQIMFNAGGLASGIYFYRLKADGFTTARKFMLLK